MASNRELSTVLRLPIPAELDPVNVQGMPVLTPSLMGELREYGWTAAGVVLKVIDSSHKVLVAEHKITEKNPTVVWGPNSETAKGSERKIEHLRATAARCIWQEWGEDPNRLGLREYGNVSVSELRRGDVSLLAYTIPVFMPDKTRDRLVASPPDTPEIYRVQSLRPDEILDIHNLRDCTESWVIDEVGVPEARLPEKIGKPYRFPNVAHDPLMHDLDRASFAGAVLLGSPQVA